MISRNASRSFRRSRTPKLTFLVFLGLFYWIIFCDDNEKVFVSFFFFVCGGGFLPLLPRQDSVHKLSISLVVKKWICSLMRLVIIWSAVTCHRFLQIFVQNCWIRAAICSCRGGKKLGEKKRKTNKPVFVSLQLFHFFLLIISFSFFVSTREIYIPFG
jgi:hypothetical protein